MSKEQFKIGGGFFLHDARMSIVLGLVLFNLLHR